MGLSPSLSSSGMVTTLIVLVNPAPALHPVTTITLSPTNTQKRHPSQTCSLKPHLLSFILQTYNTPEEAFCLVQNIPPTYDKPVAHYIKPMFAIKTPAKQFVTTE